jgi:D-aspartate ligase
VLKVGNYPLHHASLGVVRSLGRLGVPVYGVYEERFAPAAVSRYLRGRIVWRADARDVDGFLEGMAALGRRLGRPTVLIPTDDRGAILISEHASTLATWFRFPQPPPGLAHRLASKKGLYELCGQLGVPCPRMSFPTAHHDVEQFAAAATFPVVVKAAEAWLLPPEARLKSTTIAHHPEELLGLYRRLDAGSVGNLLLQEYIPRGSGQDWFFHGYADARSECLASFTGVKLRSYPPYAGSTTLGRCQDNQVLRGQVEQLLRTIGYRGIMDLDIRLDLRDGEYKLLDFNPRVGAQFRLFEDEAAVDVVRALHLDLTGREVRRRPPVQSRVFIVEPTDLAASLVYRRAGDLNLRSWLASLRGTRETAWFARDDPAPFLLMCARWLLRATRRALRLGHRRPRNAPAPRYLLRARGGRRP